MSNMDVMYRAYRQLQMSMAKTTSYPELTKEWARADQGADAHCGAIVHHEIDMDWVEEIEKAIPYIDAAIREQRRFIVQEDEIVPIEKSRKITTESVRHLAQHTNMIAKVEGDEVTPESILNIFREESFAIYENRFLRTVLKRTVEFVEERYKGLCEGARESAAQLEMNRKIQVRKEMIQVQLRYATVYQDDFDVKISADIRGLTNFERVIRIRKILSDFIATPLMRELKKAEPVRPPITRTNLIMKNPNFRAVLDLWIFLESYTEKGYHSILSEAEGSMKADMQRGLYDVLNLTRFVVKMNLSEELRAGLEKVYQAENARIEAERKSLEEKRKQEEEKRLMHALQELASRYEEKLKELEQSRMDEIASLKSAFEEEIQGLAVAHSQELESVKREHEGVVSALIEEQKARISAINEENERNLSALRSEYEEKAADEISQYEARISTINEENERNLSALRSEYEEKSDEELSQYEETLSSLKEYHALELEEIQKNHQQEINAVKESWTGERRKLYDENNELKQERIIVKRQHLEYQRTQQNTQKELKKELSQLKKENSNLLRKNEKMAHLIEENEKRYRKQSETNERRYQRKIQKLEMKLQKALKKCPYQEVMEAGEQGANED